MIGENAGCKDPHQTSENNFEKCLWTHFHFNFLAGSISNFNYNNYSVSSVFIQLFLYNLSNIQRNLLGCMRIAHLHRLLAHQIQ
jgi:hypothetical protein